MMEAVTGVVYLLFELGLLLAALRATEFGARLAGRPFVGAERHVLALSINILLSGLLGTACSFTRVNSPLAYVAGGLAVAAAVCGGRPWLLVADLLRIVKTNGAMLRGDRLHAGLAGIVTAVVGVPAIWAAMRPSLNGDSVVNMTSVLQWMHNEVTPYSYINFSSYPAFWELTLLPSLSITSTDHYLWFASLKAVMLLGLAAACVGRELGLSTAASRAAGVLVVALPMLWLPDSPTGVATIKNDMIVGAGALLLAMAALAARRDTHPARVGMLVALSLPMLTTKFNGPALAFPGVLTVLWLGRHLMRTAPRPTAAWAGIALAVVMATTGHYYVKNWMVYGNPVYPGAVELAGRVVFAGPYDLRHSTVLANLANPRTLAIIAGSGGWVGPLTPLFVAVSGAASLGILGASLLAAARRRPSDPGLAVVGLLLLTGWFAYIFTPFSAGWTLGDFGYLKNWRSARFALGSIAMSDVLVCVLVCRLFGQRAAMVVALLSAGTRLAILNSPERLRLDAEIMISTQVVAGAAALTANALASRLARHWLRWAAAAVVLTAVAIVVPWVVEQHRAEWWAREYGDAVGSVWTRTGTTIGVAAADRGWVPTYFAAGPRLSNNVVRFAGPDDSNIASVRPDLLAWFAHPERLIGGAAEAELGRTVGALRRWSYVPLALNLTHVVAKHDPRAADWTGAFLLGVENANGIETVGGRPFFWIGQGDTTMTIWASDKGECELLFDAVAGPSVPGPAVRRLSVLGGNGPAVLRVIEAGRAVRITAPVRQGLNALVLRPLDTVASPARPGGDPRPLVLGVADLSVSMAAPSAASPGASSDCSIAFAEGWHGVEQGAASWLRWSEGVGSLHVATANGGRFYLSGSLSTAAVPNTVTIRVNDRPVETIDRFVQAFVGQAFGPVAIDLPAGNHWVEFRSRRPGAPLASDSRSLAIAVIDLRFTPARGGRPCAIRF